MDRNTDIGTSKSVNNSDTEREDLAMEEEFHLNDGELKVKINTFLWENGPGHWTLNEADAVACKMFEAFRQAEETAKEKPAIYRNDDGRMWEVCLTDERSYTDTRRRLSVECHIGEESGDVVGFNVFDESLKTKEKP